MNNHQLASILRCHALLLLSMAGTAMAHAPPGQVASQLAGNMAEHIQVYRQLHEILSHPRCIFAPGTRQFERLAHADIIDQREYAGRMIESNLETPEGPEAGKCQTVVPRTTPIEPCIYGESTASPGIVRPTD